MTTIALHAYHEQIDTLLTNGDHQLAAEHCRHILQQKPQHIATYRLLAKAMLEEGEYPGARDLFQRILSADPNDYIAHAGLAMIFKEENIPSQAIWHLERAYEIEPYNPAIQQELRVLYLEYFEKQPNGQTPRKSRINMKNVSLTPGALARLYLRGELYDQAAVLLRTALAEDEERIDLRVLLGEALWRDGQRIEAVEVCLQVLDQLPYCIVANAILAEIWLRTGRVQEAQTYLQRIQLLTLADYRHLNMESPVGVAFRTEGAAELPEEMEVDYLGTAVPEDGYDDAEDWAEGEPGTRAPDTAATEAADDEAMYDWLEGLTGELPLLDEATPPPASSVSALLAQQDDNWQEPAVEAEEFEEVDETAVAGKPVSDWLADLANAPDEEDQAEEQFDFAAATVYPQNKSDDDDDFDWLADTSDAPPRGAPVSSEALIDSEAPDWLADLDNEELRAIQVDPLTAAVWMKEDAQSTTTTDAPSDNDAFGWLDFPDEETAVDLDPAAGEIDLTQFADFHDNETDQDNGEVEWRLTDELNPVDEPDEEPIDTSAWLSDPDALPAESAIPSDDDDDDDDDDIPDWLLTDVLAEDLYEESSPETDGLASELADWVAANSAELLDDPEASAWLEEEAEETELEIAADSPQPLFESNQEESAPLDEADLPDWLRGDAYDIPDSAPLPADAATPTWSDDTAEDGPLPDWLEASSTEIDDADETESAPPVADSPLLTAGLEWLSAEAYSPEEESAKRLDDYDDNDDDEDILFMAAGVEQEEAVSDDKEEKLDVPEEEPKSWAEDAAQSSEELDWLDDLAGLSESASEDDVLPLADDGLLPDWMQMDLAEVSDTAVSQPPDASAEIEEAPEELDWLDALAAGEPEAAPLDEMPTWQWPEDEAAAADDSLADTPEALLETEALEAELEDVYPDNLDDAMAWLEDLALEPDAPVEELPTVAEQLDQFTPELAENTDNIEFKTLLETPVADNLFPDDTPQEDDFSDDEFELPPDDPEAAMAWLEQLAARQGAPLDELPSVDTFATAVPSDTPPTAEEWTEEELVSAELLAADTEPEEATAEEITLTTADEVAADEIEELSFDDVPDDPDEAMAWLERLAARQGAPLDELPSVTEETYIAESLPAEADEPDDAMAWLEQLTTEQSPTPDQLLAMVAESDAADAEPTPDAIPDSDLLALVDELDDDEAASLFDDEPWDLDFTDEAAITEDDDAQWLAQFNEETPASDADEMWLTEESVPASPAVDAALLAELDWLEQTISLDDTEAATAVDLADVEVDEAELAAALEQLALLSRPPTASDSPAEEAIELSDIDDLSLSEAVSDLQPDQDTPDAATDEADNWQEWLAESAEPTPETADDDLAIFDDIPDDPDAAMAWLERLAARQGASLDELPSLADADEETLAELTAAAEANAAALWPLELEEERAETAETAEAPDTAATAVSATAAPDNIDDAMAWLEQLAARQGASLDELPTVTGSEETFATPDWILAAQEAAQTEADDTATSIEETAVDLTTDDWDTAFLAGVVAESETPPPSDESPLDDLDELNLELDEFDALSDLGEMDDLLPDWLAAEAGEGEARVLGHTDWLGTLPEPDLDGWLAAEEEATIAGAPEPEPVAARFDEPAAAAPPAPIDPVHETPLPDEFADDEDFLTTDLDVAFTSVALDVEQLAGARAAIDAGDIDTALSGYATLVEAGEGLNSIIIDLETAADRFQEQPLLRRMLGDAYMRNGQLQKALEHYREALDQM